MGKSSQAAVKWPFLTSILLGAVTALGPAMFNAPLSMLVGFATGGFLILRAENARQAALWTWGLGIGYFGVALSWLVEPFMVDVARHGWMAPFALLFMSAGLALLWAIAAGCAYRIAPPSLRWLALAVTLTAAELIRARLFTGFPWGNPGHAWIDTRFDQLAAYFGASGLGALTFLLAMMLAQIERCLRSSPRSAIAYAAGFTGIAGLAFIFSGQGLSVTQPHHQVVTIRLVQPNAPQHLKWDPDYALEFVMRQIEYTRAEVAADAPKPDLIVWPETAVPTLLEWATDILPEIAAAADGTPLLFGVQRGEGRKYYNSLALLGADGQVNATYDKHHLVPFGEYIPFGNFLESFGVSAFAARAGNGYSAGPGPQVLDLGRAGTVLPLICYEAIFPREIRNAPARADWILHATNDAWFGENLMPYQHLAQAQFRAIEFGLPVIRVANTGISAVIDANGNVRAQIPLGEAGFLDAPLPRAKSMTPYARVGDLPLIWLVIVAIGALLALRMRNAR